MKEKLKNSEKNYLFPGRGAVLLLIFLLVLSLIAPVYANNELDDARRQREEIEQRVEQEEEALEEQRSREEELQGELRQLDAEIRQIRGELIQLNREITITERHIMAAERDLRYAEERLAHREGLLMKRLRVMHERGSVNYLEVLLESTSFAEFLTRFYYLQAIAESDKLLMDEIEEERNIIIGKKEELEEQKQDLEDLRDQVTVNKENVDRAIDERSVVLDKLQEEIERTEQLIQELEEDAEEMSRKIEEILERQRLEAARGGYRPEGDLLWPVEGPSYITSPFGYRSNPFTGGSQFHGGLDIGTYGQPNRIFAAEVGTVVFARYSGGYGNYIMVDHGGGMMTLYAHLSSMAVGAGQTVARGETIGRAGTTGASTGVHLHFEVWIDGVRKDPLGFL